MITVYTFGPAFGLPDPSSFCLKTLTHLRMSGLTYKRRSGDVRKAPKHKAPWIDDDGELIGDSTLIRQHLETKHGINFDGDHTVKDLAVAHAFEKMCEEGLYWAVVHDRWMDIENFERGPSKFFEKVPGLMRPIVETMVKRQVRRDLHSQGTGRHTDAERFDMARRSVDALAEQVGDGPYLLGDKVCGADASTFAMAAGLLVDIFDTPLKDHAAARPELVGYRDRMLAEFFGDVASDGITATADAA